LKQLSKLQQLFQLLKFSLLLTWYVAARDFGSGCVLAEGRHTLCISTDAKRRLGQKIRCKNRGDIVAPCFLTYLRIPSLAIRAR